MSIKKLLTNYIGILFITFLSLLGSFFTNIFINYNYGKDIFGQYSTIYNIVMFFSTFVAFGVGQFLLREMSVDKIKFISKIKYLKRLLLLTYVLSIITYFFFILFINYDPKLKILLLISVPLIFLLGAINLYSNIKLAEKKFVTSTIINTLLHIIILVTLIIVYIFEFRFTTFIAILSIISLISTIFLFYKINTFFKVLPLSAKQKQLNSTLQFKDVLKSVWPFGIIGLLYFIYYQSDILLLSFFKGSNDVAEYNAAFSIMAALLVFPRVFYQRLLAPFIYQTHYKKNKNNKYKYLQIIFTIISILIYLIILLFSKQVINLLFGEVYTDAHIILKILGVSFVLRFIYGYSSVVMNFEENLNSKMRIMAITAILNLVLNMFLIPKYGVYGAAGSTVFAEMMLCLLMIYSKDIIRRIK